MFSNTYNKKGMVATLCVVIVSFFLSWSNETMEIVEAMDRKSVPGQYATDIVSLISDSGIVKYRMNAPEWYVYDQADTPYWYFPKGLLVESFDANMNVEASITSKEARYYVDNKLWDLRDSVVAKNTSGEHFETNRLFWDQNEERVYSNERIKITQEERIIIGRGFESNQQFTQYTITKPEGVFPIEDK